MLLLWCISLKESIYPNSINVKLLARRMQKILWSTISVYFPIIIVLLLLFTRKLNKNMCQNSALKCCHGTRFFPLSALLQCTMQLTLCKIGNCGFKPDSNHSLYFLAVQFFHFCLQYFYSCSTVRPRIIRLWSKLTKNKTFTFLNF